MCSYNSIGINLYNSYNNDVSNNVFIGNNVDVRDNQQTDENPFPLGIVVILVIVIALSTLTAGILFIKRRRVRNVIIPYKNEAKLKTYISEVKTKEVKPILPSSTRMAGKSIKICPHCGQKLHLEAKFCFMCSKKVEEDQVIPSMSDGKDDMLVSEIPSIKDDGGQPSPSISDSWKEKLTPEISDLKVDKIQPVPLIKEEKEEIKIIEGSLTEIKEKQPVPLVSDSKEKRLKVVPYFCKFCGMKLNKKATFCLQCGTKVKKK